MISKCPKCSRDMTLRPAWIGKRVKCPSCRAVFEAGTQSLTRRAVAFVGALLSGRASPETVAMRRKSCFGSAGASDGAPAEPCPRLRRGADGYHYCGACGCGENPLARLDGLTPKIALRRVVCPLGRPGFG